MLRSFLTNIKGKANIYYDNSSNVPFVFPRTGCLAYWKMDSTAWADSTGNGKTLTNTGVSILTGGGPSGLNCASFTATGQLLTAPTTFSLNAFTISAWVKYTSSGGYQVIAQEWDGNTGWAFWFGTQAAGNLSCATKNTSGTNTGYFIQDGNWHFCALSYDPTSGNMNQYVDNKTPYVTTYTATALATSSRNLTIGSDTTQSVNSVTQKMCCMGVWSRVLTSGEISSLYGGGTPPAY